MKMSMNIVWHAKEMTVVEEMEQGENPFKDRVIGVTKKGQIEKKSNENKDEIKGKKCSSCLRGFNKTSQIIKCHDCDSVSHRRLACMSTGKQNDQFMCKL